MPNRAAVQLKSIYGQPYIEVDGSLGVSETDTVLAESRQLCVVAAHDLPRFAQGRYVDASFLLAMEPTTYQLARTADGWPCSPSVRTSPR